MMNSNSLFQTLPRQSLNTNPADVEALKELKCGDSTIGEMLTEKIAKIGENYEHQTFRKN